ncbi:MAG TPA: hypothetical protein VJX67_17680, partial [Blastocatellia bacterium]|nr:hypothetical protein [Blastocatellia bacterium]
MNELETAPPDNTPLPPERAKPELNSPKIPITVQPSQRLSSEGNSKPANDAESDSVSQHPAVDSPDGTVRAR